MIQRYAGDKVIALSTDVFPTTISDGATLYTLDTKQEYLKSGSWYLIAGAGNTFNISGQTITGSIISVTGSNIYTGLTNLQPTGGILTAICQNQKIILSGKFDSIPNVVYTTGTQTIDGNKTFLSQLSTPLIFGTLGSTSFIDINGGNLGPNDASIDFSNCQLFDLAVSTSVDWNVKTLNGAKASLDWDNGILNSNWSGTNIIYSRNGFVGPSNLNLISYSTNTGIILSGGYINLYGNTSGSSPSTTSFTLPSSEPIYGGTGNLMGKPVGWIDIYISGVLRKLPYY